MINLDKQQFNWLDLDANYVNLKHRYDRENHMQIELKRVGLMDSLQINRFDAYKTDEHTWDEERVKVMRNRTPGAIGCHYSQVGCMQKSLVNGKSALVMEDDLIFASDIIARLDYIEKFVNAHTWDVVWLGATFQVNPSYWHTNNNPELTDCTCKPARDAECTDDPRMLRTYGCFSTYAYIVNYNSIEKVLKMLDNVVHLSMGIDWAFIKISPELHAYSFVPGCVKQMDNQSDIGTGITKFSGFEKLGPYWWQDKMEQFNPNTFNWGEVKNGI